MVSPAQVFQAVAAAFGVPETFIVSPFRHREISTARFAAWKILTDRDPFITPQSIAQLSGWRDRTSVVYGIRRAKELLESEPEFKARIDAANHSIDNPTKEHAI